MKEEFFIDAEYKDESPLMTVEKIKGILADNQIETQIVWHKTLVPYCFANTISVVGTNFSVNGKGLTEEFALASGYGELMERLQLGYTGSVDIQKDGNFTADVCNRKIKDVKDLFEDNKHWYKRMSEALYAYLGIKVEPEEILNQFADETGKIRVIPYWNAVKGKRADYSSGLVKRVYSANGCAAGNTMEEAVVQAISEIVERYNHMRIVNERLILPTIPDETLKKYKTAYKIISFLRGWGLEVEVKDCSLGEKFPVVSVLIIDKKTGGYHTHEGAYPIFEIALERALTESFQGRNIMNIGTFSGFVFEQTEKETINAMTNELTKGAWGRPVSYFIGDCTYEYNENQGFEGSNSKELYKECIDYFRDMGYDVLIRNASCLGFPTYQVIVPGYSEVFIHRISLEHHDFRYIAEASQALRNPDSAEENCIEGLWCHIKEMDKLSRNMRVHSFCYGAKLSTTLKSADDKWLMDATMAYMYFRKGEYGETLKFIEQMIPKVKEYNMFSAEYLIAVKKYVSMKQNGYTPEKIIEVLNIFHSEETVSEIKGVMETNKNPLDRYVLHCDGKCGNDCFLRKYCCQKRVQELFDLISKKSEELDFENFKNEIEGKLN